MNKRKYTLQKERQRVHLHGNQERILNYVKKFKKQNERICECVLKKWKEHIHEN